MNIELLEEGPAEIYTDKLQDPYEAYYKDSERGLWGLYDGVIGELFIDKLNMNYYVFQAIDNEKYLDINENGESDKHGCIFGDYRNNFEYLDENNVLYGHNMADGTMFAGLLKMKNSDYFTDVEDYFINFNSLGYNNVFKVFSVYETDLTSFNYIKTGFDTFDKMEFIDTVLEKNTLDIFDTDIPYDSKILTLSTCTNGGKTRLVVHAYLVGREVV